MSLNKVISSEKPFLLGVTTETPRSRKIGYAWARARSDVLSTRIALPGADERNAAISTGDQAFDLINDGAFAASSQ